jgi:Domain of unknown function (DUF5658)
MRPLKIPQSLHIESRKVRYTFCALFCLVIADGLITQFLVTHEGIPELNPFMGALLGQGRVFMAVKISGAFVATLLLWKNYNARPRLVFTITAVGLALYITIIYLNLFAFLFWRG